MGNRLTQITTRTGDDGTTGLGDGTRTRKSDPRIHVIGEVDELNSQLGLLLCEDIPADIRELLIDIQHQLFNLGGELSIPGFELLQKTAVLQLDQALAQYNQTLPKLQEFILPAGSRSASLAHVCRTIARRTERALIELEQTQTVHATAKHYLNRLSDLLFVIARQLNHASGMGDVYWKSHRLTQKTTTNPKQES